MNGLNLRAADESSVLGNDLPPLPNRLRPPRCALPAEGRGAYRRTLNVRSLSPSRHGLSRAHFGVTPARRPLSPSRERVRERGRDENNLITFPAHFGEHL